MAHLAKKWAGAVGVRVVETVGLPGRGGGGGQGPVEGRRAATSVTRRLGGGSNGNYRCGGSCSKPSASSSYGTTALRLHGGDCLFAVAAVGTPLTPPSAFLSSE